MGSLPTVVFETLPATYTPQLATQNLFLLTVEQYQAMGRAGLLPEDSSIELLRGILVNRIPTGPEHAYLVGRIARLLESLISSSWSVRQQAPLALSGSEPVPDVLILRGPDNSYRHRLPSREDTVLVIEVSDSSLARDLGLNSRIYAEEGIAQYLVVHIEEKALTHFREPSPDGYRRIVKYALNDEIALDFEGEPHCLSVERFFE